MALVKVCSYYKGSGLLRNIYIYIYMYKDKIKLHKYI